MQSEEKIKFMLGISSDCSIFNKDCSLKIAKSVPLGISLRPNLQSLSAIKEKMSIKESDNDINALISYHQSLNIPLISRALLIDLYWKARHNDSENYKDILRINSLLSDAIMLSYQKNNQFIVYEKYINEKATKLAQEIKDVENVKNIMDSLFYINHSFNYMQFSPNRQYENSLAYSIIRMIQDEDFNSLFSINPTNVFREISLNPYDFFATYPCATLDSVSEPTTSVGADLELLLFGKIMKEKDPLVIHLLLSLLGGGYNLIFYDLHGHKLLVQCPFFIGCSIEKHFFKCSIECIKNKVISIISDSCMKSLIELEGGSGDEMDQKLPEGLRGTRIGKMIKTEGRCLPDAYTEKYISKTKNLMQKKEDIAQIEIDFLSNIPMDSAKIMRSIAEEIFSQYGIENISVEAHFE